VVITTDKFSEFAQESATQSGLSDARIVAVTHPIGGTPKDGLSRLADAATDQIMSRLLGQ
jgi:hypothetical protein